MKYSTEHQGHDLNSFNDWQRLRMSPRLRKWLIKAVAAGLNYEAIKSLTRSDEHTLSMLEAVDSPGAEKVEISEITRITNKDFNNYRRRHLKNVAELSPDCLASLHTYAEHIKRDGGIAVVENLATKISEKQADFYFGFCTKWQISVLKQYSSVLCLDSTHNTCYALNDSSRKAFLYTIVLKHDGAGCGVPVAFMVTSSETQEPLASWLIWLRQSVTLIRTPIFMIDCSKTEMAAINSAFEAPEIRLCYWHMLRAIRLKSNSKLFLDKSKSGKRPRLSDDTKDIRQLRKVAVEDFIALMHSSTVSEFGEAWKQYKFKYSDHEDWINYLHDQWMCKAEMWWLGNRKVSLNLPN